MSPTVYLTVIQKIRIESHYQTCEEYIHGWWASITHIQYWSVIIRQSGHKPRLTARDQRCTAWLLPVQVSFSSHRIDLQQLRSVASCQSRLPGVVLESYPVGPAPAPYLCGADS